MIKYSAKINEKSSFDLIKFIVTVALSLLILQKLFHIKNKTGSFVREMGNKHVEADTF